MISLARAAFVILLALAPLARAQSLPPTPLFQDPMGPMVDVTLDWQAYQPASDFCIKPNVVDPTDQIVSALMPLNPDWQANASGSDPVCAAAGFQPTDTGLYKGHIETPILCQGCRRIFFDYSQIPANDSSQLLFYAHGHVYFRTSSLNPTYSIDPLQHSPNIKNFTNDKLVAPFDSPQEQIAHAIDTYDMSYVGDTKSYAHTASQGPYYIGPTYRHCDESGCVGINGAYVDVKVDSFGPLPDPNLNLITYQAGFNSGEATCLDNDFPPYGDANFFYGGCVDHFGFSSGGVNPFP